MKFSYLGMDYKGLAVQNNAENTVEGRLFEALRKICLINPDDSVPIFQTRYTRCGRTDKGVSALGNVCSLYLRKLKDNDYTQRINHCLPKEIRILGHAEVGPEFDARFSCIFREYNYFFFAQNLNIPLMARASQKFIGQHDFRNFCKKDESMIVYDDNEDPHYIRRIFFFRTQLVQRNT